MADGILFEPGAPIRLELLDGPELAPIQASIYHHTHTEIQVTLPGGIEIPVGMPVHGEVPDADCLHTFDTVCLGPAHTHDRTIRLALPDGFERTQRRAYTRVPDELTVSVILRDGERIASISSVTFDVSIGGLSLLAPRDMTGQLTLVLSVPNAEGGLPKRLRLDGEVRRSAPVGERTWRVAVAFNELSTDEEQILSQYLFRRMREIRRANASRV
ncbi:MAG: PilZ domain-containing protein [Candidatus Sericytochromatia bacterium]|nr:PilZ domain-containing protein [Candidatus Sericytochromatia bacterium]